MEMADGATLKAKSLGIAGLTMVKMHFLSYSIKTGKI